MCLGKNIFFLIFLFPLFCFSQIAENSILIEKSQNGKYDDTYERANNSHDALDNPTKNNYLTALAKLNKSKIEIRLGKYEVSITSAQMALGKFNSTKHIANVSEAYNLLIMGYYFLSKYDSAQIYYEKSYELKKRFGDYKKELAKSSNNIASVYEDLSMSWDDIKIYKETEQQILKNKDDYSFLSDVYVGMSHFYFNNKDINEAEKYAEKAMEIGLDVYGEFHWEMTLVYTAYANILESKKKYTESIQLLHESLKITEKYFGNKHRWTCKSNYDLANAYAMGGQYELAEEYYKKAVEIAKRNGHLYNLSIAKTYLSKLFIDQGIKLDQAAVFLSESLDYKLSVFGTKNEEIAEIYNLLAKRALLLNDESGFNSYVQKALISCNYFDGNLGSVINPFAALDALILKSLFYEKTYEETGSTKFLDAKYELIDRKLNLIKSIQNKFTSDRSRIYIANKYRGVFENDLNTCWSLYYKSIKDQKYLNKAFELSETNRNASLLEGIQNSQFKKYANIPEEMLLLESQMKQGLSQINVDLYYEQTNNKTDKQIIDELKNQRIILGDKLDSLQNAFESTYPEYAGLKYRSKILKITDIKNDLDDETQMITYFLGEKNLYTFNITNDNVTFLKSIASDKIINNVTQLKDGLLNRENIDDTSAELYLYLLSQQVNISKLNIVIIPDDVLNYIPFEILQNENQEFLIENYTISYSGSARLYLELKNKFFDYELPNYWVGFSPKYNSTNSLSSNLDETIEISEMINGKSFAGNKSSISNFLENTKKNSIVHLAMHVEINYDNPLYNKLIFSDGALTSSKIYASDIKANLAVLSACNTGFGKLEKGEGVMSMARAFNYSGVPSVIMSLWKIPDKETKKLMVFFYEHLKEGELKNEALKNAKLDYLASTTDNNLRHPYYWSGFVLNGNINSLVPIKNDKYYFISGFLLFGSVLLGMRIKNT